MAGRMGTRLMAVVAEGQRGRVYVAPADEMEVVAKTAEPMWQPDQELPRIRAGFLPRTMGCRRMPTSSPTANWLR